MLLLLGNEHSNSPQVASGLVFPFNFISVCVASTMGVLFSVLARYPVLPIGLLVANVVGTKLFELQGNLYYEVTLTTLVQLRLLYHLSGAVSRDTYTREIRYTLSVDSERPHGASHAAAWLGGLYRL
jgi:predicted neutral ceramidase superfamily lipid hydrolase